MRNRNKINQLGRTPSHRNALLMNLANALIEHKRISTTVSKAKALRGYVEPLITKSKDDTTHSRRMVFRLLQNKEAVSELFREVAPKVGDRPGGYTRIIKTGFRDGDSAEMCIIELVDFNELYTTEKSDAKKKTRRSRRGSGGASSKPKSEAAPKAEATEEAVSAQEVVETAEEATTEEAPVEEAKKEEVKQEATEEVSEEAPAEEAKAEETSAEASTEETTGEASEEEKEEGEDQEKKGE